MVNKPVAGCSGCSDCSGYSEHAPSSGPKFNADECVVCGASLMPKEDIPHCEDCVLTDEHREEWEWRAAGAPSSTEAARKHDAYREQVMCPHEHTRGGNDFLECTDCEFEWDYRRGNPPVFGLREHCPVDSKGEPPVTTATRCMELKRGPSEGWDVYCSLRRGHAGSHRAHAAHDLGDKILAVWSVADSKGEGSQPSTSIDERHGQSTTGCDGALHAQGTTATSSVDEGERSAGKPEECPTCGSIRRDVRGYHVPSRQDCRDPWHDAPLSPATPKVHCLQKGPNGYQCTLPQGHEGQHEARGWPDAPPCETWTEAAPLSPGEGPQDLAWWKAEAIAVTTLLRAKCSDAEWTELGSKFAGAGQVEGLVKALEPVMREANAFDNGATWRDLAYHSGRSKLGVYLTFAELTAIEAALLAYRKDL